MLPLKSQTNSWETRKEETLALLSQRVLQYVSEKTENPRVLDLARKLVEKIDESYDKYQDVYFEDELALDETAKRNIRFWGKCIREDLEASLLRPEYWLCTILREKSFLQQVRAQREFISIAEAL